MPFEDDSEIVPAFADHLQLLMSHQDARLSSCSLRLTCDSSCLAKIVSALKGLRQVKLCTFMQDCIDEKVDAVVRQNADLEVLHLENMRTTSASLVSVSRLTRLQDLVINGRRGSRNICNFSVDAVLTLLRGPSRHVLRLIEISCAPLALEAVAQEVERMQSERHEMSGRLRERLSLSPLPSQSDSSFPFRIRST